MGKQTINDDERAQWVSNDEGLYREYTRSRLSLRQFVRKNRAQIDEVIRNVLEGTKEPHYLAYGARKA